MPVYLLHGFRWPRPLIRIHIILQNLDDAAAEWLVAPGTTKCLLENFDSLYPEQMANLPDLRFIEQYNPEDEETKDQPYAYVADTVHEIQLGVAVEEIVGGGVKNEVWEALIDIRDKLCPGEKVGWFVVVCGDEERYFPPTPNDTPSLTSTHPSQRSQGSNGYHSYTTGRIHSDSGSSYGNGSYEDYEQAPNKRNRSTSFSRGLRKVFGVSSKKDKELRQSASMRTIKGKSSSGSSYSLSSRPSTSSKNKASPMAPPPLPGTAR